MKTPSTVPTTSAIFVDLKNEPWPQSCCTMKSRTSMKAVGTASASVSQYETRRLKYMSTQPSTNSTAVLASCQMLRFGSGRRQLREPGAPAPLGGWDLRLRHCHGLPILSVPGRPRLPIALPQQDRGAACLRPHTGPPAQLPGDVDQGLVGIEGVEDLETETRLAVSGPGRLESRVPVPTAAQQEPRRVTRRRRDPASRRPSTLRSPHTRP